MKRKLSIVALLVLLAAAIKKTWHAMSSGGSQEHAWSARKGSKWSIDPAFVGEPRLGYSWAGPVSGGWSWDEVQPYDGYGGM